MPPDSLEKPAEPSGRSARGRPRDPELEARRKEQILDVAAREFARYGFSNTQVQTIANHLGVGNGTVFRYFETKERLFLAAVERGLGELQAEVDRAFDSPVEPFERMLLAIRTYLGFFHRRPEMAELFIQERAAFPHHHRPLYFAAKDDDDRTCKQTELCRTLVETGVLRPMPMERVFSVVSDLLYGTILTNLLSGRRADPDEQARDVIDIILNGILAADAGTRGHGDKETRG